MWATSFIDSADSSEDTERQKKIQAFYLLCFLASLQNKRQMFHCDLDSWTFILRDIFWGMMCVLTSIEGDVLGVNNLKQTAIVQLQPLCENKTNFKNCTSFPLYYSHNTRAHTWRGSLERRNEIRKQRGIQLLTATSTWSVPSSFCLWITSKKYFLWADSLSDSKGTQYHVIVIKKTI